jgi:FixJ family two-component response regulator
MPSRLPIVLLVDEDAKLSRQMAKTIGHLVEIRQERDLPHLASFLNSGINLIATVVGAPVDAASPLQVLSAVKASRPSARRLLLVEPGDLSVSIAALHDGTVDHILTRPVRDQEILSVITSLISPRTMPAVAIEHALSHLARSA